MLGNLNNPYGVAFISVVIAAILTGVSLVQTLYYNANQNDTWPIKLTVAVVIILDVVHQAFISHTAYTYSITDWGNTDEFQFLIWSLVVQVILTGLTAFIVQCFLTLRVWRLSVRNIYLTGSSAILVAGGLVSLMVYVVKARQFKDVSSLTQLKWLSISVNVLALAGDSLITGILLNYSRSEFQKSDAIINKIIICTVNTGLLTSLFALGSLISIIVDGQTFIYITFFSCIGRMYTNSLLATLNARKLLRPVSTGGVNSLRAVDRLSLQNLPSSPVSPQRPNISIKIDTIQELHGEKVHDKDFGEESD